MNFFPTSLPGVTKIEPVIHGDSRGYLFESFSKKNYQKFIHDLNLTNSYELKLNTGSEMVLHLEDASLLIRCILGQVQLYISSDNIRNSPQTELNDIIDSKNHIQYFILHGYKVTLLALKENSILEIQSDKTIPSYL